MTLIWILVAVWAVVIVATGWLVVWTRPREPAREPLKPFVLTDEYRDRSEVEWQPGMMVQRSNPMRNGR
jgi:hypothetical protein